MLCVASIQRHRACSNVLPRRRDRPQTAERVPRAQQTPTVAMRNARVSREFARQRQVGWARAWIGRATRRDVEDPDTRQYSKGAVAGIAIGAGNCSCSTLAIWLAARARNQSSARRAPTAVLALVVCGPCCLGLVLCLADSDHSSNGYAGMALYVASRSRRYPTLAPSRASLCARSDRRAGCVTQAGVWRAMFSHLRVRARERRGVATRRLATARARPAF